MSDFIRLALLGSVVVFALPLAAQQVTSQPEVTPQAPAAAAVAPSAVTSSAVTTSATTKPVATIPSASAPVETPAVTEKPAYIIETLSTPVRSGPGNEYRIISSVRAAEQVTFIGQNPANGFIKIREADGTEGWLHSQYISNSPSVKASVDSLKQQLRQQEMIVAQFEQERAQLQQALTDAETVRDQAVQQAELATQTTQVLTRQLAEENPPFSKNKLIIGGGILAAGLLLGLVLPLLMPRRRRDDRWM